MEITSELKGQGIYLGGETLQCMITFKNLSHQSKVENLAWASAQIQSLCQYVDNPSSSRRKFSESGEGGSSTSLVGKFGGVASHQFVTSLQPGGDLGQHELASTKPKILFCDIYLSPGEQRSFLYEETLPKNSPSTYHGRHVRYTHRIVVATQRVNCAIATLRIPFRVIAIRGDTDSNSNDVDDEEDEPTPRITNPFFVDDKEIPKGPSLPEPANPRRVATFYDIRNATGRVGKLCLFRTWYRLGEDIIGLFDFADCNVRCMQYLVSLLCEEKPSEAGSAKLLTPTTAVVSQQPIKLLAKENSQEFCVGFEQTNFRIPVPLHATPSFDLKACRLTWMLKFEFVICSEDGVLWDQPYLNDDDDDDADDNALGHEWNGPQAVPVETMTWTLPITILPTHPSQVAQAVQMATKFNMNM